MQILLVEKEKKYIKYSTMHITKSQVLITIAETPCIQQTSQKKIYEKTLAVEIINSKKT